MDDNLYILLKSQIDKSFIKICIYGGGINGFQMPSGKYKLFRYLFN